MMIGPEACGQSRLICSSSSVCGIAVGRTILFLIRLRSVVRRSNGTQRMILARFASASTLAILEYIRVRADSSIEESPRPRTRSCRTADIHPDQVQMPRFDRFMITPTAAGVGISAHRPSRLVFVARCLLHDMFEKQVVNLFRRREILLPILTNGHTNAAFSPRICLLAAARLCFPA
jgi:hypothetical protein